MLPNIYIDCLDQNNSWRVAKIKELKNKETLDLIFDGWSHKWDEVRKK